MSSVIVFCPILNSLLNDPFFFFLLFCELCSRSFRGRFRWTRKFRITSVIELICIFKLQMHPRELFAQCSNRLKVNLKNYPSTLIETKLKFVYLND